MRKYITKDERKKVSGRSKRKTSAHSENFVKNP